MAAFAALVALGVIAVRLWRGRRPDALRVSLACLAALITFLAVIPSGCNDVGGVPDWERCWSFLGNPTLEWRGGSWMLWKTLYPILAPLVLSTGVGILVWRVVGPQPADRG